MLQRREQHATRESKFLEKEVERALNLKPPNVMEEKFLAKLAEMKEKQITDCVGFLQEFIHGLIPELSYEFLCRAVLFMNHPPHNTQYKEELVKLTGIDLDVLLDLRTIEQFQGRVHLVQSAVSGKFRFEMRFNKSGSAFWSEYVSRETISHWLDSEQFAHVMGEYASLQDTVTPLQNVVYGNTEIPKMMKIVLSKHKTMWGELGVDFCTSEQHVDSWGMSKMQINMKTKSSNGDETSRAVMLSRSQLVDWYLLGRMHKMVPQEYLELDM